MVMEKWHNWSY